MTAAKTPSQRGAANRRRGHQAERDLAKWLRANGFPHAERAVRTGWATKDRACADPGDITGTPGLIWSVKDTAVESHTKWRVELDAMLLGQDNPDACGLIVHKRRGHASPGEWWVWIMTPDLAALFGARFYGPEWWRTTLGELIVHLRGAGYGAPLEPEAPVSAPSVHGGGLTSAPAGGGTGTAGGDTEPKRDPERCAVSRRPDGLHAWQFDGDDPYVVCAYCEEMRDTINGRVIRAGAS